MKVKIEFDAGEAVRISGDPVYTTIEQVLSGLALDIAEPGAFGGEVFVAPGDKQTSVGRWEIA